MSSAAAPIKTCNLFALYNYKTPGDKKYSSVKPACPIERMFSVIALGVVNPKELFQEKHFTLLSGCLLISKRKSNQDAKLDYTDVQRDSRYLRIIPKSSLTR
jgi:hypothetical protein